VSAPIRRSLPRRSLRRLLRQAGPRFFVNRRGSMRPINSRRFDHAPELHALFFLRRVPLERWKGCWLIGITWIGDDVKGLLVANSNAIRSGDRVILAMVSSDASGR
jgi:hypothetical protein